MKINYKCAHCGKPILSPDGRKRYCSDECALEAHRTRCRERKRRLRQVDPEHVYELNHRWYMANREAKKAASLARYHANKTLKE